MFNVRGSAQRRRRAAARVAVCAGLIAVAATASAAVNAPPQIWGYAKRWAIVGELYNFQPTAYDANHNALTFSIANKPDWARFNKTTGRLFGTPTAAYLKTVNSIVIRVSDGKTSVALPAFTLKVGKATGTPPPTTSATVSWMPPVQNVDGSALTNLAGYRVRYGRDRAALDRTVTVSNVGLTKYVIDGLTGGAWYFGVAAYNRAGEESSLSPIVKKNVP